MKRTHFLTKILILLSFWGEVYSYEIIWDKITREHSQIQTVFMETHNNKIIYLGSKNSLYFTSDGGKTWQRLFSVKANNGSINFIYAKENKIFVGTTQGLYLSLD
ncbi:MAG: hypothetical protein N2Z79_05070, partial [Candidatus Omnitrophica bacterium]|nr:hypothetical protein [Candidatus Omnitrophota bacterium]